MATCTVVDGCLVQTEVTQCGNACFFGTGCCGNAGDPCCPQEPSCFDGSACVDDMCQ